MHDLMERYEKYRSPQAGIFLACCSKSASKPEMAEENGVTENTMQLWHSITRWFGNVGRMDQKKGLLVCQKEPGSEMAGQEERRLCKMR